MKIKNVKAVLFDTFGTVVDWRGSITRMGEQIAKKKGIKDINWETFANAWRAGYKPGMAKVQSGERPWTSIDVIHRERLDQILIDFGITKMFTEKDKIDLNPLKKKYLLIINHQGTIYQHQGFGVNHLLYLQ